MRTMRNFFAASVLVSALSVLAFAGDIHTGIVPDPDPAPTIAGIIQTGVAGDMQTTDSEGSVVAAALGLVQTVLSLL